MQVITSSGRAFVTSDPGGADFPWRGKAVASQLNLWFVVFVAACISSSFFLSIYWIYVTFKK